MSDFIHDRLDLHHVYPVQEQWVQIDDFPDYEVSNTGEILNSDTNRTMRKSFTKQGAVKVGLVGDDGKQYTRSVKVLVANAFVEGHTDIFDTPINLDNDQENCAASNLLWRPRWFAWKYTRQFIDEQLRSYYLVTPVIDVGDGTMYKDIFEAAKTNGLLMKDVLISCYEGIGTFPTWQQFEFAN